MAKASKATGAAKTSSTTKAGAGTAKAPPAKRAGAGTAKAPPAKKAAAKKAPAKKAAAKTSSTTKAGAGAAKAPPAKKAAAKKAPAKKAAGTKATRASGAARSARTSSPYDATFLAAQREALIGKREELLREAQVLTAEADELAQMREPGDVQFDEESGEGDTLAVERERDLALAATFRSQIEEIDHALAKIDAGTYGLCEVSGQPIPKERLRAIPWARERVEYKVGGFVRR